jgi:hypothetical protein
VTFRLLALTLLLAACRDDRPPAPTEQESAQLNEMDAALNAEAANGEGPADRSTRPSNNQAN